MTVHRLYSVFVDNMVPRELTKEEHQLNSLLGLNGEVGEITDLVKKIKFYPQDKRAEREEKIIDEVGDVLFYLTYLMNSYGLTYEKVTSHNIRKLTKRYPDGIFTLGEKQETLEKENQNG